MAALVATVPTRAGVVTTTGAAVAASDTIAAALLGDRGCYLEIINGNASPDVVVISDASTTLTGAAATAGGGSVTNATNKTFYIHPRQADPITGLVTVTNSVTATVTYKLWALTI